MNERVRDWTTGEPTIVVSSCGRCGNSWYLPHAHCPVCASGDFHTAPVKGSGLCVAVTLLHVTADQVSGPVRLCLVELDEGPLVMGQVHDPDLAPGDRAVVVFRADAHTSALTPSFAREA